MARPVTHVLPVMAVCECSFETPYLAGVPLRDFGLGPDANRLIHPNNRRPAWAPEALQAFLAELVAGIRGLHAIGIAHGDPALMNVLIVDNGGSGSATWLDLNSIRPATEENRALDWAGFLELCLWPSLLEAPYYSPSLLSAIADAAARESDLPSTLSDLLAARYEDYQAGDVRAAFADALRRIRGQQREDLFGQVHRTVQACMAPSYFLDQTISDLDCRFLLAVIAAEQTRHRLVEEETTRLHYLRFHDELEAARRAAAEANQWARQLHEELARERQQRDALEQRLAWIRNSVAGRVAEWTFAWLRRFRAAITVAALLASPQGFSRRLRNLLLWLRASARSHSRHLLKRHFNSTYYLSCYPDVAESGVPGWLHYLCVGYMEGRRPSDTFDPEYYLAQNRDVAESGVHPLLHYVLFGEPEGRRPCRHGTVLHSPRND